MSNASQRIDLGKLSDAELTERLENAWRSYNSAEARAHQSSRPWQPHDPLLPQTRLEKFSRLIFGMLFGSASTQTVLDATCRTDREVSMDESMKEIRILTSELEKRVTKQQAS